jgi:hypothetical protein
LVFHRRGRRLLASASLAALALAWTLPARTCALEAPRETSYSESTGQPAAESAARASVTLALALANSDGEERPVLDLRGRRTQPDNSSLFRVSAQVSRIPCPGEYRLTSAQEDDLTGNTETYTALIKLFEPEAHPAGTRCGLSPPRLPGHVEIILHDPEERTFRLDADREGGGPFGGSLMFRIYPECDRDYRLETDLDLSGWSRSIEFRVRVIEFSATFQGRRIPTQRC